MIVKFKRLVDVKFKYGITNIDHKIVVVIYLWLFAIVVIFDKPRTLKQWFYWNKYRIEKWFNNNKSKFNYWWHYKVLRSPAYYYWYSMDCDLCSSEGYGKSKNISEYLENERDFWDSVEGRSDMHLVSKEEYLEHKDIEFKSRDYIMEAYENGNGRNVIL